MFIHCPKGQSLWKNTFSKIWYGTVMLNAKDLCLSLCKIQRNNANNIIKINDVVATLWTIWIDRNNQIFKEKAASL